MRTFCIKLLLILFCFNSAFAKDSYVVEGEFWAAENDSNNFIKQQLKINALRGALNQFFSQMDLNSSVFWQILERRIATDLENKKNWYDKKIESARDAQKFDDVLELETKWRKYRLNYFSNYLEGRRLYLSFASAGVTSSMMNPQLKMAKFKVSLNRTTVKKLYFDITKSDSNRQYQNLLISFKVSMPFEENISSPLLSENINLIKRAVVEKWVSWFEQEYKEVFNNFIITDDVQERQLNKYIYSPPGSVNLVDMSMVKNIEEQKPDDENSDLASGPIDADNGEALKDGELPSSKTTTQNSVDSFAKSNNEMNTFKDSQWLLVKIRLSDLEVDTDFKKMSLVISGGHLFFDLNSREIILSEDYNDDATIFSFQDENTYTSSIGTKLFNLPLNGFRTGKKVFTKAPQINNQAKLKILNIRHPEKILGLSDFLNLGGDSVNLKVSSFDITESGAQITVNFFGELNNLKTKFYDWENKRVLPKTRWHFFSEEDQLNVELIPELMEGEQVNPTGPNNENKI